MYGTYISNFRNGLQLKLELPELQLKLCYIYQHNNKHNRKTYYARYIMVAKWVNIIMVFST